MAIRMRFSLKILLAVMLALTIPLGFLTWRRVAVRAEVASLQSERVAELEFVDHWLWPAVAPRASLVLKKDIDGTQFVAEQRIAKQAAAAKFEETAERLWRLGVREISISLTEEQHGQSGVIEVTKTLSFDNFQRLLDYVKR